MCGMNNTTGSGEGKAMATPQWEQYGGNWPTDKELTEASLRCMVTEVRNELSAALRREEVLREQFEQVCIGGNHLASALIGWLGAGDDTFPPFWTDYEVAREVIKDPNHYDAWVCWKTIMQTRTALSACDEVGK